MKLGIMQPYFFPYLGYFSLIKNTDRFILLDSVQFIRHGWIERNRILKQDNGWLYIQVPLIKCKRETLIKDMMIDNNQNWKPKILAQLQTYKKVAPYYYRVIKLISEVLQKDYDNIVSLNKEALVSVCKYLNLDKEIIVFSESNINIDIPKEADEWALNICKSIGGVKEYWNPPGGMGFFDRRKYEKENLKINFREVILKEYEQSRIQFESGLSIIDVLMFNSPDEINIMLDNYRLI